MVIQTTFDLPIAEANHPYVTACTIMDSLHRTGYTIILLNQFPIWLFHDIMMHLIRWIEIDFDWSSEFVILRLK